MEGFCAVCGQPIGSLEPPTYRLVEVEPGKVAPVLSKPIRMDPQTGAVCWCEPVVAPQRENVG